ncbi:MAG: hypothetical protein ACFCU1_07375 [Sumerlaeia bacterium]
MIELFLMPYVAETLLVLFALFTPAMGFALKGRLNNFPKTRTIIMLLGPVALLLWGIQLLLISLFGFAAVATYVLLLFIGILLGTASGIYLRSEFVNSTSI